MSVPAWKMAGYEHAMQEADKTPVTLQTEDASSFTLGAKLIGELLEKHPEVNGIFCTNDDLAIGAFTSVYDVVFGHPSRWRLQVSTDTTSQWRWRRV